MRTIFTIGAAALALTSTVAFAKDGEPRFTHEGQTYVYTTSVEQGRTVIAGRRLPTNQPFRLVIDGGRVTGVSNGTPVAFTTAAAKGAAGGVVGTAN
jgi:hypothetical protein